MRALLLSCLAIATAAVVPAAADPTKLDGQSVERVVEATTSMILLPASASGTLSYHLCERCPTVALGATPATRYLIGNEVVSLASMEKLFAAGHDYNAIVATQLDAPILLRLQVFPSDPTPEGSSP